MNLRKVKKREYHIYCHNADNGSHPVVCHVCDKTHKFLGRDVHILIDPYSFGIFIRIPFIADKKAGIKAYTHWNSFSCGFIFYFLCRQHCFGIPVSIQRCTDIFRLQQQVPRESFVDRSFASTCYRSGRGNLLEGVYPDYLFQKVWRK